MGTPSEPRQGTVSIEGGELCYFEWGERGARTVLMVHATGFHARIWDATVRALGPGHHVVAIDQRGHGRSLKRGPFTWQQFGADLIAFVERLDLTGIVG